MLSRRQAEPRRPMAVQNVFRESSWHLNSVRLSFRDGWIRARDDKNILAVVAARFGLDHRGLWFVRRAQNGASANYLSRLAGPKAACDAGIQSKIADQLSHAVCEGWSANGAVVLSHRRAGGLSDDCHLDQLAGARPPAISIYFPWGSAWKIQPLDHEAARYRRASAWLWAGPICNGPMGDTPRA